MEKLPKGWEFVSLEDSSIILDNQRKPVSASERAKRTGNIPYYGATGIAGTIDNYIFDEELILLGEDGAPFLDKGKNVAYLISGKSWVNNHAHVLKGKTNILKNKFLLHFLNQFDYTDYVGGTTRLKLNQGNLKKIHIPLPPLPEQKRIVAKLDTLFASIENTKSRLEKIPQLLKNFRQAVLTQAVTGKLTEEWREGKELEDVDLLLKRLSEKRNSLIKSKKIRNVILKDTDIHDNLGILPSSWRKASLYNIANIIDPNPSHRMPKYLDEGIPFMSTENISNDRLDFNKGKKVGIDTLNDQIKRFEINEGDFLYTRIGTIGKSCYLPKERNYCLSHAVCVISSYDKHDLISEYLRIIIGSQHIINQGLNGVKSVGVPDLGMGKVRCFQIPICSLSEQQEIVRRVENLFAKADAIEKQYDVLKQKIDTLPQALLAKAFKGELVEQLETDGDAKDLLEEIKKAKESLKTKGKKKK